MSDPGMAGLLGVDDLVTGEAVALDLPPASFGLRALSGAIDVAVQVGLVIGAGFASFAVATSSATAAVVGSLTVAGCLIAWPTAWETLTRGKTVGKYVVGLRTVRDDGGPIVFGHALVRALLSVVEIWMLTGLPALFAALLNRKGKRIGDLVAGTYVVRDRFSLQLLPPPGMPPELAGWAARADIAPLPDGLAVSIRQLVGRGATLAPEAWHRLVSELADRTAEHVSPLPPPGTAPERFLAAVLAERRRRDLARLAREAEQRHRLGSRHR